MVLLFAGYIVMYKIYGKYIGNRIFKINKQNKVPSKEFNDGIDYVPTKKEIVFGHHFASIAGTGPIVGPAIAIIWGWLPAILWVFIGSIIIGAVHDFGVLIVSMRNKGKSIADFTNKYINNRTRYLFFIIAFLELWIFISILGMVIAIIFDMYPGSVFPVWFEIPLAIILGYVVFKKGKNVLIWSIYAVILMYITVIIGAYLPFNLPEIFGISPIGGWTIILLIYAYIASVLPVTTLLQPRDFINSHQLLIAMALLILGVLFSSFGSDFHIIAPVIQEHPKDAPPLIPFIFIIIACGAFSGFHAIVSSGTSSKQVSNEKDTLFIGYGGMLMESALAVLVIIAVAAGIGLGYETSSGETLFGIEAWNNHYASWTSAIGLGSKISAFVIGSANMIESIHIPKSISIVVMGVFVASFAGTSLDTATRIQRYVLSELFTGIKIKFIKNRFFLTAIVVITAIFLAFSSGADGKGALSLWPLFGAINQILGTLALIVLTLYLEKKGGLKWLVTAIPAVFMIVVTLWASVLNQVNFHAGDNNLLKVINIIIIVIAVWITIEGIIMFYKKFKKIN